MDDRRFDALTRRLGSSTSRRTVLKGLVGIGAIATAGMVIGGPTEAARRGYSGPKFVVTPTPTPPPPICWEDGHACTIEDFTNCCNLACCLLGQPVGVCFDINGGSCG